MDLFNMLDSQRFFSLFSYWFIFLSSYFSLTTAEEECKSYYDLNGRTFHDSFSCPMYCCGNAFVKYCCDDPAKRSIVKHFDTLSMPDWFVIVVLLMMFFGMSLMCVYTFCFLCRRDKDALKNQRSTVDKDSTTATAISIEDIGDEHDGSGSDHAVPAPSVSGNVLPVPPAYTEPSAAPPPYSYELPPTYKL